ncbi:uncharacterized protein LOC142766987 [Rhipicephalus microplus]|uniref:uncharacterized protein LOC142766987 n=1 Tax=Rhipicephalus microplus TaxID=6941 RepID=UPI003F6B5683
MVLLVVFVTAVGVVLLNSAAQRQRDKLTSTTEPATTYKPDDEDNHEDNDYQVSVEQHISGQESTNYTTDGLGEDAGSGIDKYSTGKTIQEEEGAGTTDDKP